MIDECTYCGAEAECQDHIIYGFAIIGTKNGWRDLAHTGWAWRKSSATFTKLG